MRSMWHNLLLTDKVTKLKSAVTMLFKIIWAIRWCVWSVRGSILEWVLTEWHFKMMGNALKQTMHIRRSRNVHFFTKQKCWSIVEVLKKFSCGENDMLFVSIRFKMECRWILIRHCNFFNFTCLMNCRFHSRSNKDF